jgi:hypothetical protein
MADSVVLHLTDLHFGREAKDAQSRKNARKKCLDSLRKRLARIVKEDAVWKPTIVAITGDIGWGGIASDYEEAKNGSMKCSAICNLATTVWLFVRETTTSIEIRRSL